ncbi:Protein of unknown function [Marinobacter sp. es.048]|uniref:ZrgA family zinc uptake protein n=1 Tax=Marinobacter sp. es.048 TaxID=1761795 RepID=UPI000B58D2A2|nr:DUF2796 domain-containing protein [Marinobacter sp. es.048]SNC64101.1 Protein of unknown function [Marinobacter sp. es.048]
MTSTKVTNAILAATILTAGSTFASDNPGAHQHGHAELQLAIEGNQIDLIFTSPAYNLLGFEHRARTDDQKALVRETTEWLERTPLINTPDASCTVASVEVYHEAGGDSDDHHEHDDKAEHKHDEHEHSEGYTHSDFEVTQVLNCTGLASVETLLTPLTERFPEIEHLGIEWVWSGGQGSTRLEHTERSFSLTGQ